MWDEWQQGIHGGAPRPSARTGMPVGPWPERESEWTPEWVAWFRRMVPPPASVLQAEPTPAMGQAAASLAGPPDAVAAFLLDCRQAARAAAGVGA
jgi:hypothetical protein